MIYITSVSAATWDGARRTWPGPAELLAASGVEILKASSVYETEPVDHRTSPGS